MKDAIIKEVGLTTRGVAILKRNIEICKGCVHFFGNNFCDIIDHPLDEIAEDIAWEVDKEILKMIADDLCETLNIQNDMELKKTKDRQRT